MSKLHKKTQRKYIPATPAFARRAVKAGAKTVKDLAKIQQAHIVLMGGGR